MSPCRMNLTEKGIPAMQKNKNFWDRNAKHIVNAAAHIEAYETAFDLENRMDRMDAAVTLGTVR